MSKNKLSKELIISEAFKMIDENGTENFSVRKLASSLNVQVSSLYNHIKSENDILLEVAKKAGVMYTEYIKEETSMLQGDEAVYKAGDGFKNFITFHKHLYDLLIDPRLLGDPDFEKSIESFTLPIYAILYQYGITDKKSMDHMYIVMRTITHGFSSLDALGIFENLSISATESYHIMIKSAIDAMKRLGENK